MEKRELRVCGYCDTFEPGEGQLFGCCAKCGKEYYCGKKCQVAGWSKHKKFCSGRKPRPTDILSLPSIKGKTAMPPPPPAVEEIAFRQVVDSAKLPCPCLSPRLAAIWKANENSECCHPDCRRQFFGAPGQKTVQSLEACVCRLACPKTFAHIVQSIYCSLPCLLRFAADLSGDERAESLYLLALLNTRMDVVQDSLRHAH